MGFFFGMVFGFCAGWLLKNDITAGAVRGAWQEVKKLVNQ